MPNLSDSLHSLDQYYDLISNLKEEMKKQMNSNLPKPHKDEIQGMMEKQLEVYERLRRNVLEDLLTFPPHHSKHFSKLPEFEKDGDYEKSVFIMTKIPKRAEAGNN